MSFQKMLLRSGDWIEEPKEGKRYKTDQDIHVFNELSEVVPTFELMYGAIYDDIQNPEGSGAATLAAPHRVERGQSEFEELGGNAWYTYITREKVWFEGHYSQGEGGEVSFEQYKLAVQTYVRFLNDPEYKPIQVEFPDC